MLRLCTVSVGSLTHRYICITSLAHLDPLVPRRHSVSVVQDLERQKIFELWLVYAKTHGATNPIEIRLIMLRLTYAPTIVIKTAIHREMSLKLVRLSHRKGIERNKYVEDGQDLTGKDALSFAALLNSSRDVHTRSARQRNAAGRAMVLVIAFGLARFKHLPHKQIYHANTSLMFDAGDSERKILSRKCCAVRIDRSSTKMIECTRNLQKRAQVPI